MHEKNLNFVILFDFYSPLLTDKQREIFDMYYNNDYSLSEIADTFGISRQGVHDLIRRTENILTNFEAKLKLVARFSEQKSKLKELKELSVKLRNHDSNYDELLLRVIQLANELVTT